MATNDSEHANSSLQNIGIDSFVTDGTQDSGTINSFVRRFSEPMPSKISSDSSKRRVAFDRERRKAPRFGLFAIAEVTDPDDARLVSAKIGDLSRTGCYVNSPKTFPIGTSLKVIISRDDCTLVAKANVIHVQEQMGMGLAFLDLSEDQLNMLDSWLAALPCA